MFRYHFSYPFNMSGNPAASIPCGFSSEGLPIGLQIIGRKGDELSVLKASAAFEEFSPWTNKHPSIVNQYISWKFEWLYGWFLRELA